MSGGADGGSGGGISLGGGVQTLVSGAKDNGPLNIALDVYPMQKGEADGT